MPKSKLVPAFLVLALFVALSPVSSQAAPWPWTTAPRPAASLLTKVERWLSRLLSRPERPAAGEKQGCAIDPHGEPLCVGNGAPAAEPPSTDSSGSV